MLLWLVKRLGRYQDAVELPSNVTIQAADDLGLGLAFPGASLDPDAGRPVPGHPPDRDQAQRPVRFTVAAAVEAVPGVSTPTVTSIWESGRVDRATHRLLLCVGGLVARTSQAMDCWQPNAEPRRPHRAVTTSPPPMSARRAAKRTRRTQRTVRSTPGRGNPKQSSQLALAGPGRRRRKTTAVPAINSTRRKPPTRTRGQTAGAAATTAGGAGAGLALDPLPLTTG
jgi:hypothetical protein